MKARDMYLAQALMMSSLMTNDGPFGLPIAKEERVSAARPEKKCLECGTIHDHNNHWCSPECCKLYRSKKKKKK